MAEKKDSKQEVKKEKKPVSKKSEKKSQKGEKKKNIFVRMFTAIARFFRETRAEAKKVVWPTRTQVMKNTAVTIAMVIVVGVFIWILDFALQHLMQFAISL